MRGEVQNIASAVGWYRLLTRNYVYKRGEAKKCLGDAFLQALDRERNGVTNGSMVEIYWDIYWDNHPRKKEITGAYCLPLWNYLFSMKNARKVLPA